MKNDEVFYLFMILTKKTNSIKTIVNHEVIKKYFR